MSTRLRLARPEDGPALAAIYEPYVLGTTVSFELEPPNGEVMAGRVVKTMARLPWLVLEEGGRVRAYAYATRLRQRPAYDWIVESSVYVDEAEHGRGLGSRVYAALFDILSLQRLLWAYAAIALPNPGSQRFHEQMGFERLGSFPAVGYKHGQWCDIDWWRRPLASMGAGRPLPVISVTEPELADAIEARLAQPS